MTILSIYTIIPALGLVCYCALLYVILRFQKNHSIKAYSIYIISNIIWSLGSFLMRTSLYPGPLFWNRILCVGLVSMPVVFYHFTLVFIEDHSIHKKMCFGYLSAIILIILNFFGLIIKDAYMTDGTFSYELGPMASVVAVWSLFYLVRALANLISKVRTKEISFNSVKFIIYGLSLVIVGGLLNLLPSVGKYPVDILTNIINALLIAYSIYRYRFLKVGLVVRKGITYSIYSLILTATYVSIVFIVENMLRSVIGYTTLISATITSIIIAFIFGPIRIQMQDLVDKIFYKDKFYLRSILKNFSQIVSNTLDLEEFVHSLLRIIKRGVSVQNAYLMLDKDDKGQYTTFSTTGSRSEPNLTFESNHPIIKWLEDHNQVLTMNEINSIPYFKGLWEKEKKHFKELEIELFMGIKLRNKLIGILLLPVKLNEEPYTLEDTELLSTLVNSSAATIENARLYKKAKEDAITDGLTKLYNHRHFHETFHNIINNDIIQDFSIIMIDVDHFKLYNDLYGHYEGDQSLLKIGGIIKQYIKDEYIAARYGGEEFAILMPGVGQHNALQLSERIRTSIENQFNSTENKSHFLTASLGLASYPEDTSNPRDLLKLADAALYQAKRNGRNQTVLYSDIDEPRNTLDTKRLDRTSSSIENAYSSAIYALAAAIDVKDSYTYTHSENVSTYGVELAIAAGLSEESIDIIRQAGLLHDIGKIGIPEHILTKESPLTNEEFEIMKQHVDLSITMVKHVPSMLKLIPVILTHHERFDGQGYPRRLKGNNIPIEGRCLCIVDAFDAMTTDRPYRKALTIENALEEIKRNSGTQFDPNLANIFISLFEKNKNLTQQAI